MPRTEEEEAAATEAAPVAAGDVEMIKEKKEEARKAPRRPRAKKARRNPRRKSPRQGRGKRRRRLRLPPPKRPPPPTRLPGKSRRRKRNNFSGLGSSPALTGRLPVPLLPAHGHRALIVGLGNPGRGYRRTRHNAGFMVVEQLAARWKTDWTNKRSSRRGMAGASGTAAGVVCQPQTFMNLSGEAVGALLGFYQLPLERLLVVVDDADLPLGQLRLRPGAAAAGITGWSPSSSIWARGTFGGCGSASAGRMARGKSRIMCWRVSTRTKRRCWKKFWSGRPTRRNAGWPTEWKWQ